MGDDEFYKDLSNIETSMKAFTDLKRDDEFAEKLQAHREWLSHIRHERPSTLVHYRVAVYIRYFNQTRYDNYLEYQKKQFLDTLALCPNWTMVGFYIDEGSTAPNMESAKEWAHLLQDCEDGKVDLIITQKVSNVSKKSYEMAFCARLLACWKPPVGIYFISEDIYTLANYYNEDLHNDWFNRDIEPIEDWILKQQDPTPLLDQGDRK